MTPSWGSASIAKLALDRSDDLAPQPPEIVALIEWAASLLVRLEVDERETHLWLSLIDRKSFGGALGSGAVVMRRVLEYAEAKRKPVHLMVIDGKRLVRYYRALGFIVDRKFPHDDGADVWMRTAVR